MILRKKDVPQLLRIAEDLERQAAAIRKICDAAENLTESARTVLSDNNSNISELEKMDRSQLLTALEGLSHKELGEIYVQAGGVRKNKSKNSGWLTDQIVQLLIEISQRHRSLRDE